MFDLVRNSKLLVGIILGLLAIPFVFFGVDSYFSDASDVNVVAEVSGTPISRQEYGRALQQRQQQLRQMMQDVDQATLDSPEVRRAVLDQLVEERVAYAAGLRAGMTVTDAELQASIRAVPAFQEDGKFSPQRYEQVLRSQDMSKPVFEAILRQDVVLTQSRDSFGATAFVPSTVLDRLYRLRQQQREVSQHVLAPEQFVSQVTLEPGAAQAYYDAHKDQFRVSEKVRIEYVLLSSEGIEKRVQVSPEEVNKHYEERASQYEKPEQRRASHILIAVAAAASPEAKSQARQKAEGLLAQAQKAPQSFAELARKNSEDLGSAVDGGDLGFKLRKDLLPAFADTLFGMQPQQIAGLVETQHGYHIIMLDAVQPAEVISFDQVKAQLEDEVRKAKAAKQFAEDAENFSNLAYENPDSLRPVMDAFRLQSQTSSWITPEGGEMPLLNHPKLLSALFTEDVLKNKRNSEAVEIAPNMLVAARVIEQQPASQQPFAQVQAQIVQRLTSEKAAEFAKREGEQTLAKLMKGEAVAVNWSVPRTVSRERREGLHPEAAQVVFRVDQGKLPAYVGTPAPEGRYVLYRVGKVVNVDTVDAEARKALGRQLNQLTGQETQTATIGALKQKAKIRVDLKKLDPNAATG